MTTPQELLNDIKDGLSASAWSSAVQVARTGGAVTVHRQEGKRIFLDVTMNRPLPYRVELDLQVGDWHCPCKSANGTCGHAAAAALYLIHLQREADEGVMALDAEADPPGPAGAASAGLSGSVPTGAQSLSPPSRGSTSTVQGSMSSGFTPSTATTQRVIAPNPIPRPGMPQSSGQVSAAASLSSSLAGSLSGVTQASRAAARRPHLRHRLTLEDGRWKLDSFVVHPDKPNVSIPLGNHPPSDLNRTQADVALLGLKRAGLSPDRIRPLLQALAMCDDVWADTHPVKVLLDPLRPILLVEDHPQGMMARLSPGPQTLQIFKSGITLVVSATPPVTRPSFQTGSSPVPSPQKAVLQLLGSSSLPAHEAELYERGRLFSSSQAISSFFADHLPRLQNLITVEVRSQHKPNTQRDLRPYPRVTLQPGPTPGTLHVLPSITYGTPPQAVVSGERMHLLQGAVGMPQRHLSQERALAAQFGRHHLTPGHAQLFSGESAIHFVQSTLPILQKRLQVQVDNPHIAERMKVYDAPLRARWEKDPKTGELKLTFALEVKEKSSSAPGMAGKAPNAPDKTEGPLRYVDAETVMRAWRDGAGLVPLLDGGFAQLPKSWLNELGDVLQALLDASEEAEPLRAPLMAQLMADSDTAPDAEGLKQAVLSRQKRLPVAVPETLKATLRPYQHDGLSWLKHLETQSIGGVLADDMGLGKTLQTLALILTDAPNAGPTLVVAPTSVLDNWQKEARKFAPSLTHRIYHGDKRTVDDLKEARLIITSYALLRLDLKDLKAIEWHRVILDEAQAIKNPDSQAARAARELKANHRLVLTGTPVENRLEELWSLLEFLNPGMLGSRRAFDALYTTGGGRDNDARTVARLRARVQPFLLRRLKQDVARELPGKTEVVLKARLTREERKVYDAVRVAGRKEVEQLLRTQGKGRSKFQLLEVLLRMRQACCHTGLVPGSGEVGQHVSSKVKLLLEQLEVILAEGHKALVFSQWTGLLDRVEPALHSARIDFVRLDGSTRDRPAVVEKFQSDDGPGVFLISLKAGGTGLNLTAADYVYHLDPWWNPAVEDQATDRAYRIGQTRPVVVNRLIASDSIEERVMLLQEQKRAIADAALGGDGSWLETLSEAEIEGLLG